MTIEEKMEYFRQLSIDAANKQSEEKVNSYKQSLDEEFEAYKEKVDHLSETQESALKSRVLSDAKKDLSAKQSEMRKEVTENRKILRNKLFTRVKSELDEFRKTDEYTKSLINQIKNLMDTYRDYEITFIIDPTDSHLFAEIHEATGAKMELGNKDFKGGIRCMVPEKNILIDESYQTRWLEEKERFSVNL